MKTNPVSRFGCGRLFVALTFFVTGCTHMNYADRARTPLRPMVSVVRTKSNDFDTPPRVLEGSRPEYPEPEGAHREKGFVSIICTIGVDGKATEFEIESMTGISFAYEAIRAITKWKWTPATKNGKPVTGKVRVPMHFNAL